MFATSWYEFLSLDVPALGTAICASVSCAVLGNYLVLRRLSLMGDAISHAVLPGIVIAFLISGSRGTIPVVLGAIVAGVLTAVLVELVGKLGRVQSGAAMGVVFSVLFALGVVLIEQAAARQVDLDADCLLHGQLESVFWHPPKELGDWFSWSVVQALPGELVGSAVILLMVLLFVVFFYKELALSSFDPELSTSLGYSSNLLHYLLMIFVAAAVVGSFSAVGSILVIAMIICPAATARLYTDRLKRQIVVSVAVAIVASIVGYFLAAFGPFWVGGTHSLNAAGMIATTLGMFLSFAVVTAPRYGMLAKQLRDLRIARQVAGEDVLGLLYRIEESAETTLTESTVLRTAWSSGIRSWLAHRLALRVLRAGADIETQSEILRLTDLGRTKAQSLIRSHRLWESYLVRQLGLRPDHVHDRAMELEHFTSDELRERLAEREQNPSQDPHGKPIPDEK